MNKTLILITFFMFSSCAARQGVLAPLEQKPEAVTVDIRMEPVYFSPNGDDLQDDAFIYPIVQSRSDISKWQLLIRPRNRSKKIQKMTGAGIPALIKWDGRNRKNQWVKEGPYAATLKVWGRGFKAVSPSRIVYVDNTPPEVDLSISVSTLDKSILTDQNVVFEPQFNDASPVKQWQIQVIDQTGRTAYLYSSTGAVHPAAWDGMDRDTGVLVPQGMYQCAIQAWDAAGNESDPFFRDLTVNVSPREMLEEVLSGEFTIHETALGLIIQLPAKELFVQRKGKVSFSKKADKILREASVVVNAYGDKPVHLDGYSNVSKKFNQDRDVSSLYAWRVYSSLVKKGKVKASRITVRGRGRSPMFDRRSLGLALLSNGVEIIIEGQGGW